MNTDIANILKGYIVGLPFADKVAGLVRVHSFDSPTDSNELFKKVIPIACDVTQAQCNSGKYDSLVPDSKKKSVMYFEDQGINPGSSDARDFSFESKIRLVAWLNLKKLGKTNCSASAMAVASVLKAMPGGYINSAPYTRIRIEQQGEVIKDKSIFSKYSYEEEKSQYLMYPFDYFALDFSIKFIIPRQCITDWENGAETCDNGTT